MLVYVSSKGMTWRGRREAQEFEVLRHYMTTLRPAWETVYLITCCPNGWGGQINSKIW